MYRYTERKLGVAVGECQAESLCSVERQRSVVPNGMEWEMASPFGDRLRALRKGKAYSLDRLAELTGSSKSYIWELENREVPKPSGEKLMSLARALDTTVDALISGEADPEAADVQDQVFFRQFRGLDPDSKDKVRSIVSAWSKPR